MARAWVMMFRRIQSPNDGLGSGRVPSPKRTPGFPVEFPGVDELHTALLNESRTRICRGRPVQKIRDHGPKTDFSNAFTLLHEDSYSCRSLLPV
jgi:hypothetical protein